MNILFLRAIRAYEKKDKEDKDKDYKLKIRIKYAFNPNNARGVKNSDLRKTIFLPKIATDRLIEILFPSSFLINNFLRVSLCRLIF